MGSKRQQVRSPPPVRSLSAQRKWWSINTGPQKAWCWLGENPPSAGPTEDSWKAAFRGLDHRGRGSSNAIVSRVAAHRAAEESL